MRFTYAEEPEFCRAREEADQEWPANAFDDEDDDSEERQASNLSMDEVRELLDEFEEILRS